MSMIDISGDAKAYDLSTNIQVLAANLISFAKNIQTQIMDLQAIPEYMQNASAQEQAYFTSLNNVATIAIQTAPVYPGKPDVIPA